MFKARYGLPLNVVVNLYNALVVVPVISLLITLNYLKLYPTWEFGTQLTRFSEKTYRTIVKTTIDKISSLPTIHMKNRFDKGHLLGEWERCFLIIDSFPIFISRPKNNKLQNAVFAGKFKKHCFKYELANRIRDGKICWLARPAAGTASDVTITRKSGFLDYLLSDELVMADKLYKGRDFENFITPKKKPSRKQMANFDLEKWEELRLNNRILSRVRVLVEHTIGRMKKFGVLKGVWRGSYDFQAKVVLAVANITNFWIEENPLRATEKKRKQKYSYEV